MNELAINIEYLLLSHNQVIVPSLGVFRTMLTPARWIDGENLFLPPVRNVHFDPSLTTDPEEIFLQSLSEIYHLTPEESIARCEEMVAEFHKALVTEGSVDFGSIGVFTIEDDAVITMASCECGVITPAYYGLDALHIEQLTHQAAPTPYITVTEPPIDNSDILLDGTYTEEKEDITAHTDSDHVTFKIPRKVLNYALTIAAAILLFFIVNPTSITSEKSEHGKQARMHMFLQPNMVQEPASESDFYYEDSVSEELTDFDGTLIDVTQEALNEGMDLGAEMSGSKEDPKSIQTTTSTPAQKQQPAAATQPQQQQSAAVAKPQQQQPAAVAKPQQQQPAAATQPLKPQPTTVAQPQKVQPVAEAKGQFAIVLASAIAKSNAEDYVNKLAKQGIKAKVYEKGKMRRVIIDGFSSDAEARNKMNSLKETNENMHSAWVLQL